MNKSQNQNNGKCCACDGNVVVTAASLLVSLRNSEENRYRSIDQSIDRCQLFVPRNLTVENYAKRNAT